MTQEAARPRLTIPRFNRSNFPPGYGGLPISSTQGNCYAWVLNGDLDPLLHPEQIGREPPQERCGSTPGEVIAGAWTHYEAGHNPPGMLVEHDHEYEESTHRWFAQVEAHIGRGPEPDGCATQAEARAAAWGWYWRRAKLAAVAWPLALSLTDQEVANVEAHDARLDALDAQLGGEPAMPNDDMPDDDGPPDCTTRGRR